MIKDNTEKGVHVQYPQDGILYSAEESKLWKEEPNWLY